MPCEPNPLCELTFSTSSLFSLKNGMQQKDNFLCLVEMNSGYDFILVLTEIYKFSLSFLLHDFGYTNLRSNYMRKHQL